MVGWMPPPTPLIARPLFVTHAIWILNLIQIYLRFFVHVERFFMDSQLLRRQRSLPRYRRLLLGGCRLHS